ncbi:hypothetical protein KAH55_00925, partial [bacterium]|nr:hypothetical protein [bacterium]
QARTLGIWATLHVQQKVIDINGYRGLADTLAVGYFDQYGNIVMLSEAERDNPKYSALSKSIEPYELLEEDRPNKWLVNLKVSKSLWKGAEVSFYVNNLFYHRPLYQKQRRSSNSPSYERRNPDIFYGLEFSTILGDLF